MNKLKATESTIHWGKIYSIWILFQLGQGDEVVVTEAP